MLMILAVVGGPKEEKRPAVEETAPEEAPEEPTAQEEWGDGQDPWASE